jgi:hypothetical protein
VRVREQSHLGDAGLLEQLREAFVVYVTGEVPYVDLGLLRQLHHR